MKNYALLAVGLNLVAGLTLGGCETTAAVKTETVEVKVPVAIQPIQPKDVPEPPVSLGPRPPTLQQSADKALAGWCDAVAYMLRADPLLRLSAGLPTRVLAIYPECEKH